MSLQQKIEQSFLRDAKLKVLFLFDDKNEFSDEIEKVEIPGLRTIKYQNNPLSLKVKLRSDWAMEKVLIYCPFATPVKQDEIRKFPLMDILVANKELKLGDVGGFMEQYQLPAATQSLVARYMQELKYSQVQEVLKPVLNTQSFTEANLQKGMVSAILKFTSPQPWDIILAKLFILTRAENASEFLRVTKKLKETKLDIVVLDRFADYFDENPGSLTVEALGALLKKLKYNLITQYLETVKYDPYANLKIKHSISLSRLGMFFEQARDHAKLGPEFVSTILEQAKDVKEETILQYYGREANYGWLTDDLKWLLLYECMAQIPVNAATILKELERMGLHHEENREIRIMLSACQHTASCLQLIQSIRSYRLNTPEEYVFMYKDEFYKIDLAYRKAIFKLNSIDSADIPAYISVDLLRKELNEKYDTWLEKINREWIACLATKQFDYAQIGLPKQYDFYKNEVGPFDQKVVVFISDALRYEVAMELLNEMHNDSKSEAEIKLMLASVPSKTSVGMSNLLPGKSREFKDDQINVNGIDVSSSTGRESVLKMVNPKAIVVSHAQVEQNNQEQNRELFKSPVVFIYHNLIDATGDDRKSEMRTFKAADDAIQEIKRLVKKIHGNYNVSRVIITADHGFIYNDQKIADADREDSVTENAIITHSRFAITDKQIKPPLGYCFPLSSTTLFKDERWVIIPASTNRYKKQGSGLQYVHGGASLQELVIPVIESARRREDITQKVKVKLLTQEPRIVSNILRVEILQENNVSRYEKGRTVKLGIYKGYDLVSTEQEIHLDSSSEFASERLHNINLSLMKQGLSQAVLTLKIFDSEDSLNPLIEKNVINNTLIQTDF